MSPRSTRVSRALAVVLPLALAAGCAAEAHQDQQMINPAGSSAQAVDGHMWTMLIVGTVVWIIVVVAMLVALVRRKESTSESAHRRAPLVVLVSGAIIPAVIIVAIMAQSVLVLQQTDPGDVGEDTVVEVIGHQYWWEVRYPQSGIIDANEIHIPTGRRVRLEITTNDVIHSVWVPSLAGKMDMIPGRTNTMWLETDQPGTYWGQCAEFCGVQHALMRFAVVAHEPEEFDGWVAGRAEAFAQAAPPSPAVPNAPVQPPEAPEVPPTEAPLPGGPAEPATEEELVTRGREVFMSSSCVYCHAIAGTEAQGEFGPDLTHLASRASLGAGIMPNNRGNLAGWIVDPQSIKPGNEMPGTDLSGTDLQAMLAYLESLE
ncbi:MAG: cytochrome c oxidase subunit II [Mobilicoccus sp.]|nr:cytochrome c oxidase subunit II [Mobilicoccus sp.]